MTTPLGTIRSLLHEHFPNLAANRSEKTTQKRPGGGYGPHFPLNEWLGTTRNTCGMWPFVLGTETPIIGAQLGVRCDTNEPVGCDPLAWFDAGIIKQPSCFILSNPAVGKSSLLRKMMIGSRACGTNVLVLGDRKNEHTDLVKLMGGQVISLGPGRGIVNILDPGEAIEAAERILNECPDRDLAETTASQLMGDMHARRLQMTAGLLDIYRHNRITGHESTILDAALRWLHDNEDRVPYLGDLLRVLRDGPVEVRAAANDHGDDGEYQSAIRDLENDLVGLTTGTGLGHMFNGPTTEPILRDRSVAFDISGIDEADKDLLSAAYIACWSSGFGMARVARALADAGLEDRRRYFAVLDEFWQPLAASPGMVQRVNALTRLNREWGMAVAYASHTMSDLEALSSETDKAMARGIVDRCEIKILGALGREELEKRVSGVVQLRRSEIERLISWNAPASLSTTSGQRRDLVGRGKFLIKVGETPGIPVTVQFTQREHDLGIHDTNKRIRKAGAHA